jgi:hypothetical protein
VPQSLTSTGAAFPASLSVPTDTDLRNAASITGAFQAALDGAKYLWNAWYAVASIAALQAIAAPADGLTRFVPKLGVYRFVLGDATATTAPLVYRDNGNTGAWFHELASMVLPVGSTRNSIVAQASAKFASSYGTRNFSTVTTSVGIVTDGGSNSFGLTFPNALAGDVIVATATGLVEILPATLQTTGLFSLTVAENSGADVVKNEAQHTVNGGAGVGITEKFSMSFRHTVAASGSLIVKMVGARTAGDGSVSVDSPATIIGTQIRP